MKTITKEMQENMTPKDALNLLKAGNQRFVDNLKFNRDLLQQVNETSSGQNPCAVILSCIDSRTSSELLFDLGIGDVFNARIAGNIINEDILGSMEFACKAAGSKLIVVLGHSQCGAVKGACDHVKLGNLTGLLDKIQPAIEAETTITDNRTAANTEFVEKVSSININNTVQNIMDESPVLNEMINNGEIGIIGGNYDITTGEVEFYDDTLVPA